jgi:hypothetical protein
MLLAFYFPPKRSDYPKMNPMELLWSLDPIGCVLFIAGAALVILALDWTGGTYAWDDPHVGAPLGIGLALLVLFGLYGMLFDHDVKVVESEADGPTEWKGRTDGIVAHVMFQNGYNFPLSVFAFAVEGYAE